MEQEQNRRPSPPLLASDGSGSGIGSNSNDTGGAFLSNTNDNGNSNSNSNINENGVTPSSSSSKDDDVRTGTLSSASFNILSTMVGGGSLSLPLAFYQAGNGLTAPLLLLLIAYLVKSSIRFLIEASLLSTRLSASSSSSSNKKGTVSYESVSCAAFGPSAKYLSMGLISTICFFTIVGYGVLLRDMLLPISDFIFPPIIDTNDHDNENDGPSAAHNATLLFVVLLVSPLCTLRNLSALESVGALSMISLLILACCISYRSLQCNFSTEYDDIRHMPWYDYVNYTPVSDGNVTQWDNILNALPILISVFMCHFNVLPVHNELIDTSQSNVNNLFQITIWGAFVFYVAVGFIGSMYGNCTARGIVESNVLLSFDETDVLLMVGRACLSLTITFAFPILVVPARDIFLRGLEEFCGWYKKVKGKNNGDGGDDDGGIGGGLGSEYRLRDIEDDDDDHDDGDDLFSNDLEEPLLFDDYNIHEDVDLNSEEEEEGGENRVDGDTSNDEFVDNAIMSAGTNTTRNKRESAQATEPSTEKEKKDNIWRIVSSIAIFWSGAAVACCVKDIDVVWDFLGGSLSLIMGFLIPSGAFLVLYARVVRKLKYRVDDDDDFVMDDHLRRGGGGGVEAIEMEPMTLFDKVMAWALIIIFIPMMFTLTGNAVYNLGSD